MTNVPELRPFRQKIDALDRKLIEMVSKRLKIVQSLGKFKAKKHFPFIDLEREAELKVTHAKVAKELKVDPVLIEKIFRPLILASRKKVCIRKSLHRQLDDRHRKSKAVSRKS